MSDIAKATEEMIAFAEMVKERQPGLADAVNAKMAEALAFVEETFKPWVDLAEGTITTDEFARIMDERQEAERQARFRAYGTEPPWEAICDSCSKTVVFGPEEEDDWINGESVQSDEPPPIDFTCDACVEEQEAEEDDDDDEG